MRRSTLYTVSALFIIIINAVYVLMYDRTFFRPAAGDANDHTMTALKTTQQHQKKKDTEEYTPAPVEQYFMDNMVTLGYDKTSNNPRTCNVWTDPNATNDSIYNMLQSYASDLDNYTKAIENFEGIPNVMKAIHENDQNQDDVCRKLRLHPNGLQGLFPSNQLSLSQSGYIEPLTPPMRSHKICLGKNGHFLTLDYLIHDFEAMCRMLKPTSRIILVDMGASLDFHGRYQPIMELMRLYKKFGFKFDHIYAFEITPQDPNDVYEKLPEEYIPSYHWINVGVSNEKGDKRNPLHSLLKTFDEDDLVIVKLDIDTSSIEMPLAKQLLDDEDGVYSKVVDQFYFEHHVHLGELAPAWRTSMEGSIKDSFDLFQGLRRKGIPAHFWP